MYHFIGIGGIGMSGLAKILLQKGKKVSGSDLNENSQTATLVSLGASIYFGHQESHLNEQAIVIVSSGINEENPEIKKAMSHKCPLLHRSDLLWELMNEKTSLAVTGTHGKTTTSALLTEVLIAAKQDPSFAIGGELKALFSNAHSGTGPYFVAEADESDATFLKYYPFGAIVTSIGNDHMNTFKTMDNLEKSFKQFMTQVKGPLFWCGDDPALKRSAPKGLSYGFSEQVDIRLSNFKQIGWRISFDLTTKSSKYKAIEVALAGKHNALNAAAVFALALSLGIEEDAIREGLKHFSGVKRRLEVKYEKNDLLILDDYGHHPTEIKATLKGIRNAIGKRRLVALFQPHRLSRTRDCLPDYPNLLDEADCAFFTDVYRVSEPHEEAISSETIQKALGNATHIPRESLGSFFANFLRPHDVFVSFGAGDTPKLSNEITKQFENGVPKRLQVTVLFGGKSVEHEVSLRSAEFIMKSLRDDLYDVRPLLIPKTGELPESFFSDLNSSDVVFPVLHGKFGEDGTIQGLFEIMNLPYAGCDYLGAAISMDKAITKHLMIQHSVKTAPFIDFDREACRDSMIEEIKKKMAYPLFVKGVHLGSSVSVQKVTNDKDLRKAIDDAFKLDNHVLVEKGFETIREIEFAVIDGKAYPPGEVRMIKGFYDYEAKYVNDLAEVIDQASLKDSLLKEGIALAEKAFLVARCKGFARVDCFLDENETFWLNEINPIPGFTEISLFPRICLKQGLTAQTLIDQLIILGRHKFYQQKRCFN